MKKIFALFVVIAAFAATLSAQTYDRAKIWDAEINALTEIDKKQTPPKNAVLFIGSSSIRMWTSIATDFPGLAFINRGFGGSHIEDVNHYFDRLAAPYNPKKIVFYAGENDINDGKSPERVLADFQEFVKLVRAKSPKVKIYFISLKPSGLRWHLAEKYKAANALIKAETEKQKNLIFIDVFSAMLNEKGEPMPEIFVQDRLHMNAKGYAIWRGILQKHLR